jgi:hypothetical protein
MMSDDSRSGSDAGHENKLPKAQCFCASGEPIFVCLERRRIAYSPLSGRKAQPAFLSPAYANETVR